MLHDILNALLALLLGALGCLWWLAVALFWLLVGLWALFLALAPFLAVWGAASEYAYWNRKE